tara:strand:- start:741 stop:1385 length:645 start_codon:yes stop_codon:yes gene_type:complete
MCFDQTSSLTVFTVGTLFSLALIKNYYIKNDKMSLLFGLVGFTVVIIQLFEFFIWEYKKNKKINRIFTFLLIIITFLQPLIWSLLFHYIFNIPIEFLSSLIIGIYTIYSIYYIYCNIKNFKNLNTDSGKSGRLIWDINKNCHWEKLLYIIIMIYFIVCIYQFNKELPIYIVLIIIIIFLAISKSNPFTEEGSYSSIICISGVSIPLTSYIILNK